MLRSLRRPLIVMTPKSLLRHKLSVSTPADLSEGGFQPVIGEIDEINDSDVKRVILCCGKVYYDLLEERRNRQQVDVAIIRVEQLHPFPKKYLDIQFQRYAHVDDIVWCQEESKNQGAWYQIDHHLRALLYENQQLRYVGREATASPAVGYYKLHVEQQTRLVNQALTLG